jgi:hypothetical protein
MKLIILTMLLLSCGCAIRKPVLAVYCDHKTADGKHCAAWAKHQYECVHNQYGDCTPGTR